MKKGNMVPLLVMLCAMSVLVLAVGISFARFRENWTETIPFQPEEPENLVLHQDSQWLQEENTRQITFSLENTGADRAGGTIYGLVSEGIENSGKLSISLIREGLRYTAQAQPIVEGSALHKSFGNGWTYRFLDDEGQEIVWTLQSAQRLGFQLVVENSGEITYHSLIRLVAEKTESP